MIEACLQFQVGTYQGPSAVVTIPIKNISNAPITLQNNSKYTFHSHSDILVIPAMSNINLEVKTISQLESFALEFTALNGVVGKNKHPKVNWNIKVDLDK